jgi:hypothetical protein
MQTEATKTCEPLSRREFPSGFQDGLVDGPRLLEILFPNPLCRPSMRWLKDQEKGREIPFIRLGRLIFYDPPMVRAAFAEKALKNKRR